MNQVQGGAEPWFCWKLKCFFVSIFIRWNFSLSLLYSRVLLDTKWRRSLRHVSWGWWLWRVINYMHKRWQLQLTMDRFTFLTRRRRQATIPWYIPSLFISSFQLHRIIIQAKPYENFATHFSLKHSFLTYHENHAYGFTFFYFFLFHNKKLQGVFREL
jgi:hypothetical protein